MKNAIIKVKDQGPLKKMQEILSQLLEEKFVTAILVPRMLPSEDGFVQSLVEDPRLLEEVNPIAPTMAVQSARILSDLTSTPIDSQIAVVLKPCELRASVELAKFQQVKFENVVTIGVDCLGTFEVVDYAKMVGEVKTSPSEVLLEGFKSGKIKALDGYTFRKSCQICEFPRPLNPDLSFGFFGYDPFEEMVISVGSRFEEELEDRLSLNFKDENLSGREEVIRKVTNNRRKERDRVFNQLKEQTNSMKKLMQTLSTCTRCHNCMNVCSICFCKECIFKSSTFEHRSDQFLKWAERKRAIRMPTDTLMFHLTRLNHMATSCVGCGMCDSACPNELPISSLFSLIGSELQEMFDYVPGRDLEEDPPVSTFKESELQAETGI